MNKATTVKRVIIGVLLAIAGFLGYGAADFGGASPWLANSVATSSTIAVGSSTPITIFGSTNFCTGRVITTDNTLFISFGSGGFASSTFANVAANRTLLGGLNVGHRHATGTTVFYDAELYGCGQWLVLAEETSTAAGTSTITITEYR